mmetsp:Transcript_18968/g.31077  ORF Transcript_18968/g.31077 Transcript_18968/m.31077 type:complete len:572 (+) Transcript_18968:150-1865(+)
MLAFAGYSLLTSFDRGISQNDVTPPRGDLKDPSPRSESPLTLCSATQADRGRVIASGKTQERRRAYDRHSPRNLRNGFVGSTRLASSSFLGAQVFNVPPPSLDIGSDSILRMLVGRYRTAPRRSSSSFDWDEDLDIDDLLEDTAGSLESVMLKELREDLEPAELESDGTPSMKPRKKKHIRMEMEAVREAELKKKKFAVRTCEWDIMLDRLLNYHDAFGTYDVPRRLDDPQFAELGPWVKKQRSEYSKGKLSKGRVEKLNNIGFNFVTGEQVKRAIAQTEEPLMPTPGRRPPADVPSLLPTASIDDFVRYGNAQRRSKGSSSPPPVSEWTSASDSFWEDPVPKRRTQSKSPRRSTSRPSSPPPPHAPSSSSRSITKGSRGLASTDKSSSRSSVSSRREVEQRPTSPLPAPSPSKNSKKKNALNGSLSESEVKKESWWDKGSDESEEDGDWMTDLKRRRAGRASMTRKTAKDTTNGKTRFFNMGNIEAVVAEALAKNGNKGSNGVVDQKSEPLVDLEAEIALTWATPPSLRTAAPTSPQSSDASNRQTARSAEPVMASINGMMSPMRSFPIS